jgi:hypothetical protein
MQTKLTVIMQEKVYFLHFLDVLCEMLKLSMYKSMTSLHKSPRGLREACQFWYVVNKPPILKH